MLAQTAASCILFAASANHLPPAIVMSILTVEGGREGTRAHDTNGTDDLGPGQINTIWIAEVAKAAQTTPAQAESMLQWDGCFNIRTSAAILRHEIDAAAGDFWTGVGHYHSHEPVESLSYIKKVVAAARRLFGPGVFASR
jgi:hypothetical protein